jgi:CO/xanthine dehydrogenase FAD-binding subunit
LEGDVVSRAQIRIGGAGSYAIPATEAEALLRGGKLTDERIAAAAAAAFKPARPMDNTDHEAAWRKKMAPVFVARALRACRA